MMIDRCWVCGVLGKQYVCKRDRKRFIYQPKYNVVALRYGKKISKLQTMLYNLVRKVFNSKCLQEVIFPFNLYYRMDIVVPEYKICFEMDSELHYKYIPFFHKSRKKFEEYKERDKIKSDIVKKNGWKIVRFNYNHDKDYIVKKLKKLKKEIKNG